MSKLVVGLGGGLMAGVTNAELAKLIDATECNILISAVDMTYGRAQFLYEKYGPDFTYVDSGGFTLYKKEINGMPREEFEKAAIAQKNRFLRMISVCPVSRVFELDNEFFRHDPDLLSTKNYLREEVKAITGHYPIPVFKMHQGFAYWKALCESPDYEWLSIGGLAQTRTWGKHPEKLKIMMDYARCCGKKVHFLGCGNVAVAKYAQPDTLDYSICQFAINMVFVNNELAKKGVDPKAIPFAQVKKHLTLWAFARAIQRKFLYDSFGVTDEQSDE